MLLFLNVFVVMYMVENESVTFIHSFIPHTYHETASVFFSPFRVMFRKNRIKKNVKRTIGCFIKFMNIAFNDYVHGILIFLWIRAKNDCGLSIVAERMIGTQAN